MKVRCFGRGRTSVVGGIPRFLKRPLGHFFWLAGLTYSGTKGLSNVNAKAQSARLGLTEQGFSDNLTPATVDQLWRAKGFVRLKARAGDAFLLKTDYSSCEPTIPCTFRGPTRLVGVLCRPRVRRRRNLDRRPSAQESERWIYSSHGGGMRVADVVIEADGSLSGPRETTPA